MHDRDSQAGATACLSTGGEPCAESDEVGIARIVLRLPQRGASAHVSGIFEADRLLLVWKNDAQQAIDCQFMLEFTDGAQVRGTLSLWRETRARPALRNHLGHTLRAAGDARGHGESRRSPGI